MKALGTFDNPKGMISHSNKPSNVLKAIFHASSINSNVDIYFLSQF